MTFKGVEYQTILDIERCLFVAEADEKVLQFQLKSAKLQCDKRLCDETVIKLNVQQKFIAELKNLIEDLTNKIDRLNETMNDIESKIFIGKFVKNKTNDELMSELFLSRANYFKYIDKIDKKINNTDGNDLKVSLTE